MTTTIQSDFPFQELKTPTGDVYDNQAQMQLAGFDETQMWSIVEATGDDDSEWLIYGPVHHYVNLVGYVATAEHHDGETYYEECVRTAEEAQAARLECEWCD